MTELDERIVRVEQLIEEHQRLPIHPMTAQLIRELEEQIHLLREENAARKERDIMFKESIESIHLQLGSIHSILQNGLAMKVAQALDEIQLMKANAQISQQDWKQILFPIVTHIIEGTGSLLFVGALGLVIAKIARWIP